MADTTAPVMAASEFDRLVEGIRLSDEPRYIAIVTGNAPVNRRRFIATLRDALEEEDIGLLVIPLTREYSAMASLVAHHISGDEFAELVRTHRKVALVVDWQDGAIPAEELEDPDRTPTALQQLNLAREFFVKLPHPLVLLVPDYVHALIARMARDFYRIRTTSFELLERVEATRAQVAHFLGSEEWAAQSREELEERLRTYHAALARLKSPLTGRERELRAHLLVRAGEIEQRLGLYEEAMELYEGAVRGLRELEDRRGEAQTLNNMATVRQVQGHYDEALNLHEHSLTIFRQLGDRRGEGGTLHNIASVHLLLGDCSKALQLFGEALTALRETADRHGEGLVLGGMAHVHFREGRYERAMELYEESLAIFRELGDRLGEAQTMGNMANVHQRRGRHDAALELYRRLLAIFRELGDRHSEDRTLNNIAALEATRGRHDEALHAWSQSLALCRELGDRHGEGVTLINMGLLADEISDLAAARDYWEEALEALDGLGVPEEAQVREYLDTLHWMEEMRGEEEDPHPPNG
ncbi:MAG: tetratricopeptide repeat protein [Armatimonadota bacterium]